MKIIEIMRQHLAEGRPFHSFEFFPSVLPCVTCVSSLIMLCVSPTVVTVFRPKTDEQTQALYNRLDSLKQLEPCYVDVTFGAGGSTTERSLQVVETFQNYHCVETMLHLTCTNMTRDSIKKILDQAKEMHLQNILALRGGLQHQVCVILHGAYHCGSRSP